MKITIKSLVSLILVVLCLVSFAACGNGASNTEQPAANADVVDKQTQDSVQKTGVWETATYTENTTFGEGAKTIAVEVKAENQSVVFTVKTDKTTVGEALLEHNLIAGEQGDYGLYVKSVNGMTADYDVDQTYWAFYIDGEYAMSGVDTTTIQEGVTYRLERTK